MNKDLAFLLVDLSGYTALTETHGGRTAAEITNQLMSIVGKSLVTPSKLAERIGDEAVIVS